MNIDINYRHAFLARHGEAKDWGVCYLDDEVVEGALEFMEEVGTAGNDAYADYDSLEANAEIVSLDVGELASALEDGGYETVNELMDDALFTTENYAVMSW